MIIVVLFRKYNLLMSDPFNHPFLKKDNTMYLSTICTFPLK